MKLSAYLDQHQITAAEFARRVGASKSAVGRWCRGIRTPDADAMKAIATETGGAVMPNDFFDIPTTSEAA